MSARKAAENSGANSGEKTSPVGIAVMLAMWLGVGLLPVLFSLGDMRLAFGLAGERGTAVVQYCEDLGESRYDCRGRFEPADPRAEATTDVRLPPDSDEGEMFPARLRPDGEQAVPADTQGRLAALAVPALGMALLVPLPAGLAYLIAGRRPGRVHRYAIAVLAAGFALLCAVGLVASLL
ncbi:hypothetical protein [Actinomadura sp. 21ATH]|uniref:hypothetical protein n=1 Tax=Actinomadura sp. 21ATH TaxID=1735444 RepID=UPI0035C02E7D